MVAGRDMVKDSFERDMSAPAQASFKFYLTRRVVTSKCTSSRDMEKRSNESLDYGMVQPLMNSEDDTSSI